MKYHRLQGEMVRSKLKLFMLLGCIFRCKTLFSDSLLSAALIFAAFQQVQMPQLLFSNETCSPNTVVSTGSKITYQTKVTVESGSFKLEIPRYTAYTICTLPGCKYPYSSFLNQQKWPENIGK